MELLLVLLATVVVGVCLGYLIFGQSKISKEKQILFEVVNDIHCRKTAEEMQAKLQKKYNFTKYESDTIVSSIIDGDSSYAMAYMEQLLKKYEEAK